MGYVSKDYIQEGCGLTLDPELVWETVPHSVRKNINKAERSGVKAIKVSGTPQDIDVLRSMWYKPDDPNMPHELSDSEFMFITYNAENQPIGAVILLPVGNHLFLNNLAGNELGKELRVQDFLLWHCVNYFKESGFKYIDVGVSYRESLYNFFRKWKTFTYPVIFNKPEIPLHISIFPFDSAKYNINADDNVENKSIELLQELSGINQFTFVPNTQIAENIIRQNGFEPENLTFQFPNYKTDRIFFIELPRIFSVQFGAVIFNLEIPDKTMWNTYMSLDVFKRKLVFNSILPELKEYKSLVDKRFSNHNYLTGLFSQEDIFPVNKNEKLHSAFYFTHDQNHRFHKKLEEFSISHYFDETSIEIGLPVHQNLTRFQLDYIYGIFRGVLNLCSEWVSTDSYKNYKK